ncbi:hypothetical protein PMIN01_07608 [Paraphaeosphaeria minitans]|uniref:Uncharacterized protein n=1 Tax=Paraphaeosphaeria minitans TaxID=565426 RepID=A0A9P6GHW3_9PLEO|nr:hypothetical protein PMIN01_07608 [Paraphaeosphaeria minitans]
MSSSSRHFLLGPVRLFGAGNPEPTPFKRQGRAKSGPGIPVAIRKPRQRGMRDLSARWCVAMVVQPSVRGCHALLGHLHPDGIPHTHLAPQPPPTWPFEGFAKLFLSQRWAGLRPGGVGCGCVGAMGTRGPTSRLPFTERRRPPCQRSHVDRNASNLCAVMTAGYREPLSVSERRRHDAWRRDAELSTAVSPNPTPDADVYLSWPLVYASLPSPRCKHLDGLANELWAEQTGHRLPRARGKRCKRIFIIKTADSLTHLISTEESDYRLAIRRLVFQTVTSRPAPVQRVYCVEITYGKRRLCTWAGVALRSWWPSQGDREPVFVLSGNPDLWFGPILALRLAKMAKNCALAAAGMGNHGNAPVIPRRQSH